MEVIFPVFFLAFLGFIVFVVVATIRSMQRTADSWGRLAESHGLRLTPGGTFRYPSMRGTLHGCPMVLDTFTRGTGKSRTTYTRFDVSYPRPLEIGLSLTKQGFFSGVAAMFGAQDLEIGDAAFDASVVIKGADPKEIRAFLTPARMRTIQRLLQAYPGLEIDEDGIHWSRRGLMHDENRLRDVLEDLTGAARTLVGEELVAVPVPEPAPAPAPMAAPPPLIDAVLEAPLMASAPLLLPEPSLEPPAPVTRAPVTPAPAAPAPAAPALPPPPPPAPASAALDLTEVARILFLEGLSSFEAGRRFEADFAGKEVRGTGTLASASAFSYDFVLGRDGTKAVVEILHVPSPWKKDGEPVTAEIRLPQGEDDRWAAEEDTAISFEGRLVKADALMKKLYLLDGRLSTP